VVLTSDPEDKLERKLSRALCALLMFPDWSEEPISESSFVNDVTLELLDDEVLSFEVLSVEVLDVVPDALEVLLSLESSRLVRES
jgi:hypothetical protein